MAVCEHCLRLAAEAKKPRQPSTSLSFEQRHAFKTLVPNAFKKLPRRVRLARDKHAYDNDVVPCPTLAERFHALPSEIRNHIFAILLVRPARWDIAHDPDCDFRNRADSSIVIVTLPEPDWNEYTCVRCCTWHDENKRFKKIGWEHPWRSKYAPTPANRLMCSDCWDEHFRPRPCPPCPPRPFRSRTHSNGLPAVEGIPCLCARRTDLDVLLVCWRWYMEAGHVFYTRNTFAFEDVSSFVQFAQNLWRDWCRRPLWQARTFGRDAALPIGWRHDFQRFLEQNHLERIAL